MALFSLVRDPQAVFAPEFMATLLIVFLIASLAMLYIRAVVKFHFTTTGKNESQRAPLVPHVIPFLGCLPISFIWSPFAFLSSYSALWKRQPVRFRFLFQDLYIIQGAQNLLDLVNERSVSFYFTNRYFLTNCFLLPKAAAETLLKDDSGKNVKPHPGSMVTHNNRVEYHLRSLQQRLLVGPGQSSLFLRLDFNVTKEISLLEPSQEWSHFPDFADTFKHYLTRALVDSLAGPFLNEQHPSFVNDLCIMNRDMPKLALKLPRFLVPKAYQALNRARNAVLDWHTWAMENFTSEAIDGDGDDTFWGCAVFRERQSVFAKMDGFDALAIASQDLSFIWSSQTNTITAALWLILEVFQDPELLANIRKEVQECIEPRSDGGTVRFDMKKLLHQPLLQAMFAENLRLRVHGFLVRKPELNDIRINKWAIPQNHLCIASLTSASMDPQFWSSGDRGEHPPEQFWPGRFLRRNEETNSLEFSLTGTEGHWLPFGGGSHTCPGRFLTKRQNILSLALMVTMYDCEILASARDLEMDPKTYPLGAVSPRGKIPVKLRRRM